MMLQPGAVSLYIMASFVLGFHEGLTVLGKMIKHLIWGAVYNESFSGYVSILSSPLYNIPSRFRLIGRSSERTVKS